MAVAEDAGPKTWSARALWVMAVSLLTAGIVVTGVTAWAGPAPRAWDFAWAAVLLLTFRWVGINKEQYEGAFVAMTGALFAVGVATLPPAFVALAAVGQFGAKQNWSSCVYRGLTNVASPLLWAGPVAALFQWLASGGGALQPARVVVGGAVAAAAYQLIPFAIVRFCVLKEVGRWVVPVRNALPSWSELGVYTCLAAVAVVANKAGPAWVVMLGATVLGWQQMLREQARMRHRVHDTEQAATAERSDMARQMLAQSESDRTATMATLHDGVLQSLLVAQLTAELEAEQGQGPVADAWRAQAAQLTEVGEQLRAVMRARGGVGAGHLDLTEALDEVAALLPARVQTHMRVPSLPAGTDPSAQRALLEVVRQGMSTAAWELRATNLWVIVAAEEDALLAQIVDDGHQPGDEESEHVVAARMALMRERAATVGGTVRADVRQAGGHGSKVEVRIPLGNRPLR